MPLFIKNNRAFILVPVILITTLMLMVGIYFLTFVISEQKMSESHSVSQQAYYLAESGMEYAIWKLKNDETWTTNFETNPAWSAAYTGGTTLFPNGQYEISVKNYDLAKATIYATSTLTINNKSSQRVIKTQVFKALGESAIGDNTMLTDGDLDIWASNVNVNNGSLFANDDLTVALTSNVNVQNAAQAVSNIDVLLWSTLNAPEQHAENINPPAPDPIEMPAMDFDSKDPNSLKSLAEAQGQLYSNAEFDQLLKDNPNLVLNGVVYVTGNMIEIKEGSNLTINGILATNGQITIGSWKPSCTNNVSLTINHPDGQRSGLFSKNKITLNKCVNPIIINGILYAGNEIFLNNLNSSFTLNGSMLSRTVTLFLLANGVNLNFDNSVVIDTLGATEFSPIITVEYWEEEY